MRPHSPSTHQARRSGGIGRYRAKEESVVGCYGGEEWSREEQEQESEHRQEQEREPAECKRSVQEPESRTEHFQVSLAFRRVTVYLAQPVWLTLALPVSEQEHLTRSCQWLAWALPFP